MYLDTPDYYSLQQLVSSNTSNIYFLFVFICQSFSEPFGAKNRQFRHNDWSKNAPIWPVKVQKCSSNFFYSVLPAIEPNCWEKIMKTSKIPDALNKVARYPLDRGSTPQIWYVQVLTHALSWFLAKNEILNSRLKSEAISPEGGQSGGNWSKIAGSKQQLVPFDLKHLKNMSAIMSNAQNPIFKFRTARKSHFTLEPLWDPFGPIRAPWGPQNGGPGAQSYHHELCIDRASR